MTRVGLIATIILAILTVAGCGASRTAGVSADEASIRKTDAAWLAATAAHDLDRTVPFWTDDATIFAPGMPPIVGKDAIRKYVSGAFSTPGFAISWTTEKVDVSQSGDMAYSSGNDRISVTGGDGNPVTQENRSVAVWKKQADGSWKCVMDVMSPAVYSEPK